MKTITVLVVMSLLVGIANAKEADKDVIAIVLGREITVKEKENLDGIIVGLLLGRFVKDNKIETTQKELDAFIQWRYIMREKNGEIPIPEGEQDQDRKILLKVAERWVMSWKVNKALYAKYGGEVRFQQFGPEPIDAYRDFLKKQEKNGAFQIIDKKYEAPFWHYYLYPIRGPFYSGEEGDKYMNTPYWEIELSNYKKNKEGKPGDDGSLNVNLVDSEGHELMIGIRNSGNEQRRISIKYKKTKAVIYLNIGSDYEKNFARILKNILSIKFGKDLKSRNEDYDFEIRAVLEFFEFIENRSEITRRLNKERLNKAMETDAKN